MRPDMASSTQLVVAVVGFQTTPRAHATSLPASRRALRVARRASRVALPEEPTASWPRRDP